jgi:hypothetical protein
MRMHGTLGLACALGLSLALGCGGVGSQAIEGGDASAGGGHLAQTGEASVGAGGTDAGLPGIGTTTYFTAVASGLGPCPGSGCRCLPEPLPVGADGQAACTLLYQLAAGDTCSAHGLAPADPGVAAALDAMGGAPASHPLCAVPQLSAAVLDGGSCDASPSAGWCYLTGAAAGGTCPQRIGVSASGLLPSGASALLACGKAAPSDAGVSISSAAPVGKACLPAAERSASFAGFNAREVSLEVGNAACPGAVCLVNHFEGRTTCPYGQDAQGRPPGGSTQACTVPGTGAPVQPSGPAGETVSPWCADRTASADVTCSCRCANAQGRTDDGASYCACPMGFACTQVFSALTPGDALAGGYCVRPSSVYDPATACSALCTPGTAACMGVSPN